MFYFQAPCPPPGALQQLKTLSRQLHWDILHDWFVLLLMMGCSCCSSCAGVMSVGPAVCRVNQNVTCYGALGQELHLELGDGDYIILRKENSLIFKYKRNRILLNHTRWQFIADKRTIIIPSTEREDSGTYRLDTYDVNGTDKGKYHLHLNIEAVVSSVEVSYSCMSSKRTVSCSSKGDQLHFNWTLSGNRITHQLDDGNRTLLLEKEQVGQITCHVQNHISHGQSSIELHQCPDVMFLCVWVLEIITLLSLLGGFHIYIKSKQRAVEGEEQQMSEVLHTSVDQDV
ncbi:T-cell surface antigen CD2-like isoform X2 [Brachyhypopomus gauderio]|uniref:T-cell surface antigen CD2-like isoform X2 n=1 Tax=Brachyhypopomus gauderio TaxID=698409 RepID=UPI004041ED06